MGSAESRETRETWRRIARDAPNSNSRRASNADTSEGSPPSSDGADQSKDAENSPVQDTVFIENSQTRRQSIPAITDSTSPTRNRINPRSVKPHRISGSPLKQVQNAADLSSSPSSIGASGARLLLPIKAETNRPPALASRNMPRRSRAALDDDDDDELQVPAARRRRSNTAGDVSDAASDASDAGVTGATFSSHDVMVKKFVRLALAHEVARKPIRRTDISDKVLGNTPRAFKKVFDDTNAQLQKIFGMTMSPLPQKEKVTLQQRRQAQRSTQSQGSNTTQSYIVTSILDSKYRKPALLPPVKTPSAEVEGQYTGFYSWVLTIIMLSPGKRISENKLDAHLAKANADNTVAGDRTDKIIKRMEREGYITKVRERDGGEETVDWIVGPRGKMEVGETGAAGMVRTVYNIRDDELRELENRLENTLGPETFRRKTSREGGTINGAANGEDAVDNGEGPSRNGQTSRRSTRRPENGEDGEEEEEDEEDEDVEEEDRGGDEEGEREDDEEEE